MGDQYGLPDFRQFMVGRTHFPSIAQPTDSFFSQSNIAAAPLHYEPIMVGEVLPRGIVGFGHDSPNSVTPTTATATSSAAAATLCAGGSVQMDSGWMGYDVENTRWPRQETLTLLEIRSRLDSKFKQTNQKGPLWDEVSRLMAEEYGYQRSGKKCKEKFENLYKYYKKTKERKIGRQGGKHYRFFRQLEAIYGEASTHTTVSDTHFARNSLPNDQIPHNNVLINQENQEVDHLQTPRLSDQSLSFSNSSEFETSSSENRMNYQSMEKQIGMNKKKWKAKIEDFVDSQMRKIMDTQEVWMDRLLKTIEHREKERVFREEEWRKQEAARFDQEVHHIWTKERAWVEARDAALMEALKKFMGKGLEVSQSAEPMAIENQDENGKEISYNNSRWTELEVSNLIELRTSLELRFQDGGHLDESDLWEEIAAKMGSLGYERSAIEYKEKWQHLSIYYNKAIMECRNKKQKEDLDLRSGSYFHEQYHDYYLGQEISKQRPESMGLQLIINEGTLPPSSSSDRAQADVHRHGFRHEEENLWEKYGVRYYKGKTSN